MSRRWRLLLSLKRVGLFALVVLAAFQKADARQQDPARSTAPPSSEEMASEDRELPSIADKAKDWKKFEGFQTFYWDARNGKIWLEISRWNREHLFAHSLATGLGSNPVGLDRGQLGSQYVVRFERVGPKVLLRARNVDYRAMTDDPDEQRAVVESFAESVLWGGKIAAETDGTVLVDVTNWLLSDVHGVSDKLKQTEQGEFAIDDDRSAVFLDRCNAFPNNTELEATLTFAGKQPGSHVQQVTPRPQSMTLRQHLSFIELPDADYRPREFHPRCPSIHIRFADYASPIDSPLERRLIIRHRLKKKDPLAAVSEAVEPIVYYVDSGAPQPIRDALIEGASWWNEAFEAAGFKDAFQVKVLPSDVDPQDARYNVIQWVHRSTRGWSYGGSIIDPRTGEIIKGHVTLGSLRVRQDRLLFEGLTDGANASCCGLIGVCEDATLAGLDVATTPLEIALARIRQLSAHEVGHTLGFVHNFAASTYGDRASVMDYPAPRVKITDDGQLDLSDAYGVGIGAWDTWGVQYAYSDFPDTSDEAEQLDQLVQRAIEQQMLFISDADARPAGAAHPLANLWDNGVDPAEELRHTMRVRRIALDNLGPSSLLPGQAAAALQELLVPVYLHHRYQVAAAAKLVGGVKYSYAVKEDADGAMEPVTDADQLRAVAALLTTIDPSELYLADELWAQAPPKPYSSTRDIELFPSQTSLVFDPLAAARTAADLTIGNLLQPERVSRLAMLERPQNSFDALTLVRTLADYVWRPPADRSLDPISLVIRQSLTDHLLRLADSPVASVQAKAAATFGITRVLQHLERTRVGESANRYFAEMMNEQIARFIARPHDTANVPEALRMPPGSPIGEGRR